MNVFAIMLALVLPTAFGAAAWQAVLGRPRDAAGWAASLGAGFVLGVLSVGVLIAWWPSLSPRQAFAPVAIALTGATLALAAWVYASRARRMFDAAPATAVLSPLSRALAWGLFALLAVEFWTIATQATALPSLTWDAWNAWLAKSKAWYFADRFAPVVEYGAWLAAPAGETVTTTAPGYPGTLPRVAVWMASAGSWHESAIHVLWPALWAALGFALFGYSRLAGLGKLHATITTAAVLTLPLVTAHATLAGYADLWLACGVLFAGVHLMRAFGARGAGRPWRADAAMAALWLLLLPAIKLEGAVWLACALGAIVLALLPSRWRWPALGALVGLWALGLPFGGWPIPLPGLGTLRWGWGELEVGAFGKMALTWRPVADEVFASLYLLPNWNLLWYVLPLVLLARWRAVAGGALAVLGWWLIFGYGFLFLLFFFTDASVWAENLTSLNRVLMQVVPLTVFWLSVLWARGARPRTTPASAG